MNKEKKVILMSFSNIDKDGRLKELHKVCQSLGSTQVCDRKNKGFLSFLIEIIFQLKRCDYLVVDNRSIIPFAFMYIFLKKPKVVIQDCREMYFYEEQHTFKSKLGCIFEAKMIKKADILIVANEYRADIVKEHYKLSERPIVFENIRALPEIKMGINSNKKYQHLKNYKFKIVSTSGFQNTPSERQLIDAVLQFDDVELYFVGNNLPIKLNENQQKKIHFIGRVPLEELKVILTYMQVGYVGYEIINLNTKYCASGKIYEYSYEELPILAYKNIPLKNFVEKYQVGVAGENFEELIVELRENYSKYNKNTLKLKSKINKIINKNLEKIKKQILSNI